MTNVAEQQVEPKDVLPASECLRSARAALHAGDPSEALRCLLLIPDAGDDYPAWQAASALLPRCIPAASGFAARTARVAVLGSYNINQYCDLLRLAALRSGVLIETCEAPYGQYRQELLDPGSGFHAFKAAFAVLAVDEREAALPQLSTSPAADLERETRRWTSLWESARAGGAAVVQHNFVLPAGTPFGHLSASLPGSRYRLLQELNLRLGAEAAAHAALILDCERLAAWFGKERWSDPRFWFHSKHAVSLAATPLLARHTAALIAAALGLTRKCLVLDLDNTLWGGVIGEDGLAGIRLGEGPDGEAFTAFQNYILELKNRGVLLAVCSKNNPEDARLPFEKHPAMRIRLSDIACFLANWSSKADNLREIAGRLNLGLDSLVFVDDNPAERQLVRTFLPAVEVVPLPAAPEGYVRALCACLQLEPASFTAEDSRRTEQYRGRAMAAQLLESGQPLESFYAELQMQAQIEPFNGIDLPRIAQLIGKTNQFNLTTRRHTQAALEEFTRDPACVHFSLRLRDVYADHGLVGVLIAFRRGDALDIDTWLMSCRVLGRQVEAEMLRELCLRARDAGCGHITGEYVPTPRNEIVRDIFQRFGFSPLADGTAGSGRWIYDIGRSGVTGSRFIERVQHWTASAGASWIVQPVFNAKEASSKCDVNPW